MSSVNALYGGKYLNAATVKSEGLRGKKFAIYDVRTETLRDQTKLVLELQGTDKEIALNKRNAMTLAEAFGDDYTQWKNKQIEIQLTRVMFQGNMVDGVEILPVKGGL